MSRFFRALFISAVATGAAAVLMQLIKPETSAVAPYTPVAPDPYKDVEGMTEAEQALLIQELADQV